MITPVSIVENNHYRGLNFKSSALLASGNNAYKRINVNTADYIKYIYRLSKTLCRQVYEVNVESGALQNLVLSKEPAIFIMNHTKKQPKDIDSIIFFNALLYREYLYHKAGDSCPRSKIMTGRGFLKRSPGGGEKLQWLGAVPISTSLTKDSKNENAMVLKNLIHDYVEDKINIYAFPEGALASLTFLPSNYKFQPGVSSIVKKAAENKSRVKVVPIGFAHNAKTSAIHIGEPVYFRKTDQGYYATKGNCHSKYFDKSLSKFYDGAEEAIITENGVPVTSDKIIPFISGILLKNLECCSKEAKHDLHNSVPKEYII